MIHPSSWRWAGDGRKGMMPCWMSWGMSNTVQNKMSLCAEGHTWQQGSWLPGEPLFWGSCLWEPLLLQWHETEAGIPGTKGIRVQIVKGRVTVAHPLPLLYRTITQVGGAGKSHPVTLKVEPSPDSDQVAQSFDYFHRSWVFLIYKYSKVSHLCDLWIRKCWTWLDVEYFDNQYIKIHNTLNKRWLDSNKLQGSLALSKLQKNSPMVGFLNLLVWGFFVWFCCVWCIMF